MPEFKLHEDVSKEFCSSSLKLVCIDLTQFKFNDFAGVISMFSMDNV